MSQPTLDDVVNDDSSGTDSEGEENPSSEESDTDTFIEVEPDKGPIPESNVEDGDSDDEMEEVATSTTEQEYGAPDETTNEETTLEWEWTVDEVAECAGFNGENIAAYQCEDCSAIIPIQFLSENPETPDQIERLCGSPWGECTSIVDMMLVSDGIIQTAE
jgi:hypothetical protein